jgi:hypothetical protein
MFGTEITEAEVEEVRGEAHDSVPQVPLVRLCIMLFRLLFQEIPSHLHSSPY